MKFEATLVCQKCENSRVDLIDEQQLHYIMKGEGLLRMCPKCHQETAWSLAEEERHRRGLPKRETPSPKSEKALTGANKRQHRRVRLHIPIEVRYTVSGLEFREETTTVNVSRNGVYFLTNADLRWGMTVAVVMPRPLAPDPNHPVLQARVMRIDQRRGDGPKYGIGLEFLGVTMEI